jgi:hypothetical protein
LQGGGELEIIVLVGTESQFGECIDLGVGQRRSCDQVVARLGLVQTVAAISDDAAVWMGDDGADAETAGSNGIEGRLECPLHRNRKRCERRGGTRVDACHFRRLGA